MKSVQPDCLDARGPLARDAFGGAFQPVRAERELAIGQDAVELAVDGQERLGQRSIRQVAFQASAIAASRRKFVDGGG